MGGLVAMFPIGWHEVHARGALSVLVSCIVHTALLIGLALTYYVVQPAPASVVLQAALSGAEEVSLEYSDTKDNESPAVDDLATPSAAANTELDLDVQSQLSAVTNTVDATLASVLSSSSRGGGSGGVNGGGGSAAEELNKLGANFFGSYAAGDKFVFVLDSSKSMTGERWIYACQELMDSVARLEPNQKFFVICFDNKTTCLFNTPPTRIKYQENTPEIRTRLKRWLTLHKLGPRTYPREAVSLALHMHPDAIFLLSDGEIMDDTIMVLRDANGFSTERRQVPIHTVHLMSEEGRQSLQVIASENAGTFTPIQGAGSF